MSGEADAPDLGSGLIREIGSYRLLAPLGSGGMSSVFRAAHKQTGHVVAVKILPKTLARKSSMLQRFIREAKSAEALEHPNIVAIYDRGIDKGRHYLVLEYVEGSDLHDYVHDHGPVAPELAIQIIRQVSLALRYAAARGVIHRDIKPANVLLGKDGTVKIIDLGLALQAEDEDERVTRDGTTVGTVDYMSPEQARDSRASGVRGDIYSLGCTIFYVLTGAPPYAGGDIADKLRRHATTPPPDARQFRPEVPDDLSRLVRRMMAKRPERRFQDYDELLAALDELGGPTDAPQPAEPLAALIDEDPEDEIALVPIEGEPERYRPALPAPATPPPAALIDDDDDDDAPPPRVSPAAALPRPRPPSRPEPINLAALAALSAEDVPADRRGPSSSVVRRRAIPPPDPDDIVLAPPDPFDLAPAAPDRPASWTSPVADDSETRGPWGWLIGVVVGAGLVALVVYLTRQDLWYSRETTPGGTGPTIAGPDSSGPGSSPTAPITAPGKITEPPTPTPPHPIAWVEPVETVRQPAPEPPLPDDWLARFAQPPRPGVGGPVRSVRRAGPVEGADESASHLRGALDDLKSVVELADNGPYFEPDLRIPGKDRLVRAKAGFRPILVVEPPATEFLKEQAGSITLDGNALTLEGIDLVVRVGSLGKAQTSLFRLLGGSLTLRDCTVTVLGAAGRPYQVFAIDEPEKGPRGSSIRLENTFVRASSATIFRLVGAGTEIQADRSVLVADGGPIALASGGTTPGDAEPRSIGLLRTVAASTGPLLDLSGLKLAGSAPFTVRLLGSTIARLPGGDAVTPFVVRDEGASPTVEGDQTGFVGWSGWLAAGPQKIIRVADGSQAQSAWPSFHPRSLEGSAEKLPRAVEQLTPGDLAGWLPTAQPTFDRVAAPMPRLWERTLDEFPRPNFTELLPSPGGPAFAPWSPGRPIAGLVELDFDAQKPPWNGDLGKFLRESIPPAGARLVRVHATGTGRRELTPIRLDPGTSLEVVVDPPPSGPGIVPLTWTPRARSSAEALIDVRDADLILSGVRLARSDSTGTNLLVRVDGGHLVLDRCWLDGREGGGRPLVLFRSATTRDFPDRPIARLPRADRPICRVADSLLMSHGDAIAAELGRGALCLSHCVIVSEGSAFTLRPEMVRRDRFWADLVLDRCTLVVDRAVVSPTKWPGDRPGPDRPWLVWTRGNAFLDVFQRGAPNAPRTGSMVRASDPEALAMGSVAWQSIGDAYEMTHDVVASAGPPAAPKGDFLVRWRRDWGPIHVQNATSRAKGDKQPAVRLGTARIKPGAFNPAEWYVLAPPEVGADLSRLGIAPSRSTNP